VFHHRAAVIAFVALAVGFAPVVWAYARRKRAEGSFARLVAGLRPRAALPPFAAARLRVLQAWDTDVAGASLLLCVRDEGAVLVHGGAVPIIRRLVGAYLPPAAGRDEGWLARWRTRPGVVAAARADDGGAVIVWKGLASGPRAQARLAELAAAV
jgi:hypothetical protein